MFKDLTLSLKNDKVRTFFCWLTFTITSMFIFLFFTVAMSDAVGVTMINGKSDTPSILMLSAVVLCSLEIIFANDFFIKNKARELAIRLVCGATYTQNAAFLLLQVLIVLLFALPVGIGIALLLIPFINFILNDVMYADTIVTLNFQSVLWAFLALGFVIFWTMILNLSFSYKNSASQLLNSNTLKLSKGTTTTVGGNTGKTILKMIHVLIMIAPLWLAYNETSLVLPCVFISLMGFLYVLDDLLIPLLDKYIHFKITKKVSLISLGLFRNDVRVLRMNIALNIIASTLLIMLLSMTNEVAYEILILISFVCINALLSLSLMFKFANELTDRIEKFKTLSHLGFVDKEKKRIIVKEVIDLNIYLIIIFGLYLAYTCWTYVSKGMINSNQIVIVILGMFIPLLLCGIVELIYYIKTVLKGE